MARAQIAAVPDLHPQMSEAKGRHDAALRADRIDRRSGLGTLCAWRAGNGANGRRSDRPATLPTPDENDDETSDRRAQGHVELGR